jgi:putative PIN family toxin of toxin-antitoxin system
VVLDTNVVLRGLLNEKSASGRILAACENRRIVPLLNRELMAEYRAILSDPEVVGRYPRLNARRVKVALERLAYVADIGRQRGRRFVFDRDPKDSKLIDLVILGAATHLLSTDADLLDLGTGRDEAAKRFRRRLPGVEVMHPVAFWEKYGRRIEG